MLLVRKWFKSYSRNQDGNVGMMLALALLPLLLIIGAAVDYSKLTSDVSRAQSAADTAVLAASKEYYASFRQKNARTAGDIIADLNQDSHFGSGETAIETNLNRLSDGSFEVETIISGQT